MPMA